MVFRARFQVLPSDLFPLPDAAAVAEVSLDTAIGYVDEALLPIFRGASRPAHERELTAQGVLCLFVVHDLFTRGLSIEAIEPIVDFLADYDSSELRRALLSHQTFLIAPDGSEPRLVDSFRLKLLRRSSPDLIVVDLAPFAAKIRDSNQAAKNAVVV